MIARRTRPSRAITFEAGFESWRFTFAKIAIPQIPVFVGDSDGNAHTRPDFIGGSGQGVFTSEPGNHVVLNEEGFCYNPDGSAQFLSKNAGASRVITAATLMHELHHLDDEYEWVDGAADDVKAHAEAECEAYEAELAVLGTALECSACFDPSPDEVLDILKRIEDANRGLRFYSLLL